MKKILLILTTVIIASCGTQEKTATTTSNTENITAVEEVAIDAATAVNESKGAIVNGQLSGLQDKASFAQAPFNSWFKSGYDDYTPDAETVKELKKGLKGVTIRAYMGTWCGDSQRETPQFYKLMDAAGFSEKNITLVTVDRSKREPASLVSGYDIQRVPTFIFYKNGTEIGRYVEYAQDTMEKDFLQIVSGTGYKHSYQN